jgi:anti-sigma B factor antagonist
MSMLEFRRVDEPGRTVVVVCGKTDYGNARSVSTTVTALIDDGRCHIVLDLRDVDFIDSSGLGALIGSNQLLHAHHGTLILAAPGPNVIRKFKITRTAELFSIRDSEDSVPA